MSKLPRFVAKEGFCDHLFTLENSLQNERKRDRAASPELQALIESYSQYKFIASFLSNDLCSNYYTVEKKSWQKRKRIN